MSHLGRGWLARGWRTDRAQPQIPAQTPLCPPVRTRAWHHPPQPRLAPTSQQHLVPLQGPSQASDSPPLLPQRAFWSPLSALSCIPIAEPRGRGTDLPKVTRVGRAPSHLNGCVRAPSPLDAFGSRPLRGCLHDPRPACQVQGDGRWLGLHSGASASVAPGSGAE